MIDRLYRCRACTAVFTDPKGGVCPACDSDGPNVYDVTDDGKSYDNNWYEMIMLEDYTDD